MHHHHSSLQPADNDSDEGSRNVCVQMAECCCVFNLCYTFDDEDSVDELLLANMEQRMSSAQQMTVIDPDISLSARSMDDNYTLPRDFQPMQAYYDLYEHLANTDPTLSASSPRDSPRISDQAFLDALKLLGGRTGSPSEVGRAFTILLLAIRATETGSEKREEYIRQCDYYRDMYSRSDLEDAAQAELHCLQVSPGNRERNRKQANVLYYQKAIYYTHHSSAKLALIRDYVEYCDTLKQQ